MKINIKGLAPNFYDLFLINTDSTIWLELYDKQELRRIRGELYTLVDIITSQIEDLND